MNIGDKVKIKTNYFQPPYNQGSEHVIDEIGDFEGKTIYHVGSETKGMSFYTDEIEVIK